MMMMVIYWWVALIAISVANEAHGYTNDRIPVRNFGSRKRIALAMMEADAKAALPMQYSDYPLKIKDVVTRLTASIQKSLQARKSRISIELPPAADFGVERSSKSNALATGGDSDAIKKSNREAARLITEMFAVLSTTTVVIFSTEEEAAQARTLWSSGSNKFKGKLFSSEPPVQKKGMGKLQSRRFSLQEQEQALLGTDGIYVPEGTEVLIITGPRAKDFRRIAKLNEKLGPETLIILLNARLAGVKVLGDNKRMVEDAATDGLSKVAEELESIFENVYNYSPPFLKKESKRDLLLFHEFKGIWRLAERREKKQEVPTEDGNGIMNAVTSAVKAVTGSSNEFVTIWTGNERPDEETIMKSILQ